MRYCASNAIQLAQLIATATATALTVLDGYAWKFGTKSATSACAFYGAYGAWTAYFEAAIRARNWAASRSSCSKYRVTYCASSGGWLCSRPLVKASSTTGPPK